MVPNGGFILEKEIYEKILKYTSIRGIDITGFETIKDIINVLEDEDTYYVTHIFTYLSDNDKIRQNHSKKVIKMHIDNLKINYIIVFIESLESELEKLNLLLDILFTTESEKQICIDRYTKNSNLTLKKRRSF